MKLTAKDAEVRERAPKRGLQAVTPEQLERARLIQRVTALASTVTAVAGLSVGVVAAFYASTLAGLATLAIGLLVVAVLLAKLS